MFSNEAISSKIGFIELEKLNEIMFASKSDIINDNLDGLFEQINLFIKTYQWLRKELWKCLFS